MSKKRIAVGNFLQRSKPQMKTRSAEIQTGMRATAGGHSDEFTPMRGGESG